MLDSVSCLFSFLSNSPPKSALLTNKVGPVAAFVSQAACTKFPTELLQPDTQIDPRFLDYFTHLIVAQGRAVPGKSLLRKCYNQVNLNANVDNYDLHTSN